MGPAWGASELKVVKISAPLSTFATFKMSGMSGHSLNSPKLDKLTVLQLHQCLSSTMTERFHPFLRTLPIERILKEWEAARGAF